MKASSPTISYFFAVLFASCLSRLATYSSSKSPPAMTGCRYEVAEIRSTTWASQVCSALHGRCLARKSESDRSPVHGRRSSLTEHASASQPYRRTRIKTNTPPRNSNLKIEMAPRKTPTLSSALEQLQQSQSLRLLALAETLSPKDLPQSAQKRSSTVSDDSEQNGDTHPAALEADLVHYKVFIYCPAPGREANASPGTV